MTDNERREKERQRQRDIRKRARAAKEGAAEAVVTRDDPTDEPLWRTMERVFEQNEQADRGNREARLREMLKKDPRAFLVQMTAFKKEDQADRATTAAGELDSNSRKVEEMCLKLLADIRESVEAERRE